MAATVRAVDMSKVKEGNNFRPRRKAEGDYRAKVVKAEDHLKEGALPGWVLTIQVDGDARSTYPYYLNPAEKQAWKIGAICRAVGIKVPKGRMRFDANKLVNRTLGVYLADDEFEGRMKSSIDDVFPASEVGANADEDVPEGEEIDTGDEDEAYDEGIPDDEEEEEEAPPPPRKRTRAKVAPEPEPEDEDEEEDEEPPPPPRKRARKPAPPPVEEDEDEEEDEPAPPPRRRTTPPAKKVAPTRRRKPAPPADDDEDDLDELDTDDLD